LELEFGRLVKDVGEIYPSRRATDLQCLFAGSITAVTRAAPRSRGVDHAHARSACWCTFVSAPSSDRRELLAEEFESRLDPRHCRLANRSSAFQSCTLCNAISGGQP